MKVILPSILLFYVFLLFYSHKITAQISLNVTQTASGLYGYTDTTHKFVISPQYQLATPFTPKGWAKVALNAQWGIIDTKGKWIVKPQYDYIGWSDDALYQAYSNNPSQNFTQYNSYNSYNQFIPFKKKGFWGIMTIQGKIIVNPDYQSVTYPRNNIVQVSYEDKITKKILWGLWDSQMNELFRPSFSYLTATKFLDLFIVGKEFEWEKGKILTEFGVIHSNGTKVIGIKYSAIREIGNDFLVRDEAQKWLLYNSEGILQFGKAWQEIQTFTEQYAIVKEKEIWGMADRNGKIILEPQYQTIEILNDGNVGKKLLLKPTLQWNWVNVENKLLDTLTLEEAKKASKLYFQNDKISEISKKLPKFLAMYSQIVGYGKDSIFTIWDNREYFLVNKNNQKVFQNNQYEEVGVFAEDLLPVKQGRNWGFVNLKGKIRISLRYEAAQPFNEGLAGVKLNGKWGFVTSQEHLIISAMYDEVGSFQNGLAGAKKNGKWGIINKKGQETTPFRYESIEKVHQIGFITTSEKQKGFVNLQGKEIIAPRYDDLEFNNPNYIWVHRNGKWGIHNAHTGRDVFPPIYEKIAFDAVRNEFLTVFQSDSKIFKIE
jgi:hypothetical protein